MKKRVFLLILLGILSFNLYKTFNFLWINLSIIKNFPRMTYDQKMHEKYGYYYEFMMLVKNSTPPDATILIPPMRPPWAGSGNWMFSAYFLYPRKLINGEVNKSPKDIKNYSYALIVWKDFEANGLEKEYGWPKFKLPAEKILYMATDSGKIFKTVKGDYSPDSPINIGRYGLIKF